MTDRRDTAKCPHRTATCPAPSYCPMNCRVAADWLATAPVLADWLDTVPRGLDLDNPGDHAAIGRMVEDMDATDKAGSLE